MVDKEGELSIRFHPFSSFFCRTCRTFTFWRFLVKIPLGEHEMAISYSVNKGQQLEFFVPGRNQNMRWAAHSVRNFPPTLASHVRIYLSMSI